ncbi:hydroxyacid dehydrogenase [candidate division KSB3 bacterium]|uniref:Hydroxyacid dehydrogenase n=1 Tax=candidate division KSB3 bacterium TaxID=2044937 RepID=A0A2G6KKN6_9BACT|nr:MAG: hydroxyacid dehydrogenase [candidate division KSB3 bacterium]
MKKVLISKAIAPEGMALLNGKVETAVLPDHSAETAKQMAADVDGIILRTNVEITRDIIEAAPRLKVISRTGVGVDNIDVEAATQRGILVCNTPGMNAVSVAEHAVSLLLTLAKALPYFDREVRQGNWKTRYSYRPVELQGKTLGVIGFGRIGLYAAKILGTGFDMKVLAYDPYVTSSPYPELPVTFCELEALLSQADFVTVHLPSTPETDGLLSQKRLDLLKESAYLVNTARGSVVDEKALFDKLKAGKIAGAGLDVFEEEPLPVEHPFMQLENVIVSPHAGALTKECVSKVAVQAVQAVLDVFAGREPKYVYNK